MAEPKTYVPKSKANKPCNCKKGHADQVKRFPVGSKVIAISDFSGLTGCINEGSVGKVQYHCDDGRACILINGESHTFHFPEGYIKLIL